jgi:hypothetical protein
MTLSFSKSCILATKWRRHIGVNKVALPFVCFSVKRNYTFGVHIFTELKTWKEWTIE